MDLHIKAYHLNHWLLYDFKYLHYSVTLLSQGLNQFPGVCSDLDIIKSFHIWDHFFPLLFPKDSKILKSLEMALWEMDAQRCLNRMNK